MTRDQKLATGVLLLVVGLVWLFLSLIWMPPVTLAMAYAFAYVKADPPGVLVRASWALEIVTSLATLFYGAYSVVRFGLAHRANPV